MIEHKCEAKLHRMDYYRSNRNSRFNFLKSGNGNVYDRVLAKLRVARDLRETTLCSADDILAILVLAFATFWRVDRMEHVCAYIFYRA